MFCYNRKLKVSRRKGLFHSGFSKAEDLIPVANRIIHTGQPTSSEVKKKISLRSPENNIRVDYYKDIWTVSVIRLAIVFKFLPYLKSYVNLDSGLAVADWRDKCLALCCVQCD